jgi:hypothetical protein
MIVLNVYGPYMDKVDYCSRLFKMDSAQNIFVVIGSDLNLYLGAS